MTIEIKATKEQFEDLVQGQKIGEGEFLCEISQLPYFDVTESGSEMIKFPARVVEGPYEGFETEKTCWLEYEGKPSLGSLKGMLAALGVPYTRVNEGTIKFDEVECLGKQFIGVFKKNKKNDYHNLTFAKSVSEGKRELTELPS